MDSNTVLHELAPVFDKQSRVLFLGTIPSPKSREKGFYYAHPQNRFWPVLAAVFGEEIPQTTEQRRNFALSHGIALWDVLASCTIRGADDQSIKDPVANDLSIILNHADIRAIFTTGKKAAALYKKYCLPQTKREAIELPSTSPANCRYYTLERLCDVYRSALHTILL
ncbi:DNA-deoxyinosine glycosylase [Phocea massiliensis]|uniref:DNA-deoxyinosine glycosylase n=1 Tax=Merdimmobilis hominis TaxID=2897707 RepID=A0A938XAG1_9FIRM|nr:DNA-deoxyinosine glycosylase [Merdimmobilis hominis]MBM6921589.1 DNA-deoxyinosine glycosylase [Merdimmobilis hominis]